MKHDREVLRMLRERRKGKTQDQAAAAAGMSVRTARKYEQAAKLPSQLKQPRTHRTRANPFAADWPWVQAQLERDPALQVKTLFTILCQDYPGRYQGTQLRTLQRQAAAWRAAHGPPQAVIFEQVHIPGRMAQSDFTSMNDLKITFAGQPFDHLLYHIVLTYSNTEAVTICRSESFEALAEGVEIGLWQLGGVPVQHRTDNLSAAVVSLGHDGVRVYTDRYLALLAHYGMQPSTNSPGIAHENGDVEQAHHRFKQAVDQALRVRGHRDFADRPTYARFLQDLVRQRNLTRSVRFAEERLVLAPLPAAPLQPALDVRVTVTRFSTIRVARNTYSVPSQLIGHTLVARLRAEQIELYRGTVLVGTLPRLRGQDRHRIDYRHIIDSLVRKPGAFAHYRYHDDLFPQLVFRQAYDRLCARTPTRADREYVRLLYLAATTSETLVAAALTSVLATTAVPSWEAIQATVRPQLHPPVPVMVTPTLDLYCYDALIAGRPHAEPSR